MASLSLVCHQELVQHFAKWFSCRLRAVSLFSVVRRAKRETRKWPRAWLKARDGRGCPRFARALLSLNLKKKRDCWQSIFWSLIFSTLLGVLRQLWSLYTSHKHLGPWRHCKIRAILPRYLQLCMYESGGVWMWCLTTKGTQWNHLQKKKKESLYTYSYSLTFNLEINNYFFPPLVCFQLSDRFCTLQLPS